MSTDSSYWLTRLVLQRGIGLVYVIAFVGVLNQFRPLLGDHGLLPVRDFVARVPFRYTPSLFYLCPNDEAFLIGAWIGIALSLLTVLGISERFGTALSVGVWSGLWILYLSFVNVGQVFYGFGWESILLEAGFFAIFLGPAHVAPPTVVIWMMRWLLFRVIFGAGLIKLRGDPCWRNLTCLDYYYETQPIPNPLSWYFHWGPEWTHKAGVAFNHFVETIVPFAYFAPGAFAATAGLFTIVFQLLIMASGNLSWLNFLTLVLSFSTLNDAWLGTLLRWTAPTLETSSALNAVSLALAGLVGVMSIGPITNMLSARQIMNTSFNPFHLVGTYGAFGSVTRTRYEIIIEGTSDAALTPSTEWREYEFKGKPGDPASSPAQIAPYHLRIDWLMWFAAMSGYEDHPWFVHMVAKILQGDQAVLGLLKSNPFPNEPPRFLRAELYEYHFTTPAERRETGRWWTRRLEGLYFPATSLESPAFQRMLEQLGW